MSVPVFFHCSKCQVDWLPDCVDYTYTYDANGYAEFVFCNVCGDQLGWTEYDFSPNGIHDEYNGIYQQCKGD